MNLNVSRGGDAQTDLVSADFQHCNYHVMADHDALVHVPRQYQQSSLLPWAMVESLVARAPNLDHWGASSFGDLVRPWGYQSRWARRGRGSSPPVRVSGGTKRGLQGQ